MIKRFFTKKSVAIFLTATFLVSLLPVFNTYAETETTTQNTTVNNTSLSTFYDVITDSLYKSTVGVAKFVAGRTEPTEFVKGTVEFVVKNLIELVLIPIVSFWLAISGSLLDISIQYTIYGDGFGIIKSTISSIWTLMRDVFNISFIFLLLYAAIQQIITSTPKKKMVTSIIIAAVLINFSLFFTRIVIDASNIVATAIYNQVETVTKIDKNADVRKVITYLVDKDSINSTGSTVDLSGRIMDGLGLTTIYSSLTKSDSVSGSAEKIVGYPGLIGSVLRLILFCITASVFIILALLFIGRFVTLAILMATSPIGFVGSVIPGISGFSKQWKDSLFNQALMAPIIMFFMLLTIKVAQVVQNNSKGSLEKYFCFFLVAFLLLKSVSIAKKMSGEMGGIIDKVSGMVNGIAFGAATGGTALIGRQIIGRGADALSKSQLGSDIKNAASKGGLFGGTMKLLDKGITGTAKSTFDVRNTNVGKDTLGYANELAGANIIGKKFMEAGGKYKEGTGYSGLVAQQQKNALEAAKTAEKEASAYEQRVVDRNPELTKRYLDDKEEEKAKLSQEKANLEKKLANKDTSEDEKKQIRVDIGKLSTNISGIEKSIKDPKAGDIIKSTKENIEKSQIKINNYKTEEEKLAKEEEDIEKQLVTATGFRKQKLEKDKLDLQRRRTDLVAEKQNSDNYLNEINKLGISSALKTIDNAKQRRQNIATNIRQTWFSLRSKGERLDITAEIMRNKPKEKTPEDKRNDALIEQLKKLSDKKD